MSISNKLRKYSHGLYCFLNSAVVAGGITERALVKSLLFVYDSKFRKEWTYSKIPPHFTDFRVLGAHFVFGNELLGPYSFYRGFFSSEAIRPGDTLLDIGCGDGFLTKRFLAEKCAHVDAVDIDRDALLAARKYNDASNVTYHLLDAVEDSFPHKKYDVIVWDGALGHFSAAVTQQMLEKILAYLAENGIFVGSEALGLEGQDHLQYFHSEEELRSIFSPYFKNVKIRSTSYRLRNSDFVRREAYWRCSNTQDRLNEIEWH
jgi:2-polyprenyl-3-methyl-5-hydroxy-6-metoxy-1,4-benzoquinol methylase